MTLSILRGLWVIVGFIYCNLSFGNTVVSGNAPDFAGQTIELCIYENMIDFVEEKVVSCKVSVNGDFSFTLNNNSTQLVFAHVGVYFMFLYVEPNSRYIVQLPPRQDKKPEEKLNPYFEEKQVHLLIRECYKAEVLVPIQDELNFYIRTFDDYYGPYMAKYAYNVATQQELKDRDSTIKRIEILFPDNHFMFYNNYKNYKIGFLRLMSLKNKSKAISNEYFLNRPILYNQPSYSELFHQVYEKYFLYFGRTPQGRIIYDDINLNKSYSRLKKTLSQDQVLQNDSLKELVILKGIHDGFYTADFSREALLIVLDSLIANTQITVHKTTGQQIRKKVTKLLPGYPAPDFSLYNPEGKLKSLKDFRGKYIYLMFCTTQNYACISEFEQLKKIHEKFGEHVTIITILGDEQFLESQKYIKGKQLPWTFLHYGNYPDVLKEYDIRAFPTYFLLDNEGRMAISPAPSPSENIELKLFNELRAKGIL